VPDRIFTVEEAQALLDAEIRPLAERLVELFAAVAPMQLEWRRIVIAVGGNGGGLDHERASELREALEEAQTEVGELVDEITSHGVQVKDASQGLLDFPTEIDGEPALLCWIAGEERIAHWHTLDGGFAGRKPLP
jgi:hypothetical protein